MSELRGIRGLSEPERRKLIERAQVLRAKKIAWKVIEQELGVRREVLDRLIAERRGPKRHRCPRCHFTYGARVSAR